MTARTRSLPPIETRQVNFRLPVETWRFLTGAAAVLQLTQSQLVTTALKVFRDGLPPAKRRLIDEVITLQQKR